MMPSTRSVGLQTAQSTWKTLTWNVTKDCQQDVNEEVGIASSLKEDTKWWEDDCEADLDDIAEIAQSARP